MINLSPEQQKAYDRFIRARDKVGIVKRKGKWVRLADVQSTVDLMGFNHPFYEDNPDWYEYKEAFMAWLAVEPPFREVERMRMSRGDYGTQDSWDERDRTRTDSYKKMEE